jgi:hypothetical protein
VGSQAKAESDCKRSEAGWIDLDLEPFGPFKVEPGLENHTDKGLKPSGPRVRSGPNKAPRSSSVQRLYFDSQPLSHKLSL